MTAATARERARDLLRNLLRLLRAGWSYRPLRAGHDSPEQLAVRTIVWMMILVAVVLAITVYGASVGEHRAAQLERRLAQAQVAESLFREEGHLIINRLQTVGERALDIHARSRIERDAAARLRGAPRAASPSTADELELSALEDDAVYRLLSVLGVGRPLDRRAADAIVEQHVVRSVTDMGLGSRPAGRRAPKGTPPASAESAHGPEPAHAASSSGAEIAQNHQQVVRRALAVLALVGALVCFTLAGMASGPWRLAGAAAGVLVGALTAGTMLAMVGASRPEQGVRLLVLALLFTTLYRGRRALAVSAMTSPIEPEEAGIRSHTRLVFPGHATSPFSRRVVLLIATTALLSALTDYWYSRASVSESEASHEAFEHESAFTRKALEWTARRVRLFEATTQLAEARTREAVSVARSELMVPDLGPASARARVMVDVWSDQLRALDHAFPALYRFLDDPARGLDNPTPFYQTPVPWDLPVAAVGEPEFLLPMALWDADNERAIRAHQSMTAMLQALTFFAIAFYFFGQALGLGEGSGSRLLVRGGALLMLVGGGWSFVGEWSAWRAATGSKISERCKAYSADPAHPGRDRAQAAAQYFLRAKQSVFNGARKEAIDELDCAIELRPTFAAARDARLGMLEDEFDDVRGLTELAGFYEKAGREADALQTAFERSELVMPFSTRLWRERLRLWPPLFRAVAAARRGPQPEGTAPEGTDDIVKTLRQLADEADDPGARFDLAVAFLAAGQVPDAEREMNLGFGGLPREAPRYPEILRPQVLDELATLDEYCERARKIAGCRQLVRQMLDRSVVREDGQPHSGRKIEGRVDIAAVTPLDVQWTFSLAGGFDPARDSVHTRVYRVEPDGMPSTLELHRLDPRAITPDGAPGDAMPRYRVRQSFVLRSFCNDASSFRGEMYVNGQRLGQASWTAAGGPGKGEPPGMVAALFPELNLALCHPADWVRLGPERIRFPRPLDNISGGSARLIRGLVTPTGAPAVFLFNQYTVVSHLSHGPVYRDTMTRLMHMGFVPDLPPLRFDCSGGPADRRVLARTWQDSTGVIYVAFVFPDARRPGSECQVMDSVRQLVVLDPA